MKITEIRFSGDQIFGPDEKGQVYSQSLLWYPRLKEASPEEGISIPLALTEFTGGIWMRTSALRALYMRTRSPRQYSGSSSRTKKSMWPNLPVLSE